MWAWGSIGSWLHYRAMIGNNLSQFGVDAGQLDMGLRTYSAAVWWTTSNFNLYEAYGDFEGHKHVAASVGAAFTQSREDAQSQPGTNAPENVQIRVSDGRVIFDPDAFGPGTQITRATYRMLAIDGAVKRHGLSLEGEWYYRWVDDLVVLGPVPFTHLRDTGFQLQAAVMVRPKQVMVYAAGSKIFGEYGDPWDIGLGVNYYPFHNRAMRLNGELIIVNRSPVGNLNSPLVVGADGVIAVANLELFF
ncbi:MAG: hypothetical protein SFX73_00590 [Kofleriaceae bacterium]|nr:hypothetical protein [Kofleriaceae bacterium]